MKCTDAPDLHTKAGGYSYAGARGRATQQSGQIPEKK